MLVRAYTDAEDFLTSTRGALESHEAANSLMLGICMRLSGQAGRHRDEGGAAPCLRTVEDDHGLVAAALMTPPHKLVVYGHRGDLESGTRALVEELVGEGWRVPGVLGPNEVAAALASSWAAVTGAGYDLERRQRVYAVREVHTPVPERGQLRPATEADVALVSRWLGEFYVDVFGKEDREAAAAEVGWRVAAGDIYLWEDGRPVSMAGKTRPTRHGISVAPVYTPPALRRSGYATACVGELSRLLLASGWAFCALFADLANGTANRVYQRIGYRPVCDYDEYTFGDASGQEPAPAP